METTDKNTKRPFNILSDFFLRSGEAARLRGAQVPQILFEHCPGRIYPVS
jgi:hypothetical protein